SALYPTNMTLKPLGCALIISINDLMTDYSVSHDIQILPRETCISEVKYLAIGLRTVLEIVTESNTYRYHNDSYYLIEEITVDINNDEMITGIRVREFNDEGI